VFVYPPVPEHILDEIRSCTVAVVIGHIGPDGDCIHSQIAMQKMLQSLGVEAHLVNAGPFNRKEISQYEPLFASHVDKQLKERNPLVVMVDCSTLDRIGYLSSEIEGLTILTVDHHSSGTPFGDFAYIVPKSYSTTLCIMQLYKAFEVEITEEIANHLFFGFATDTGFFKFIGPYRGETFNLVGELINKGVSPNEIYLQMDGGKTLSSRKFLAKLLERSESHLQGRLMIVIETEQDIAEFGDAERPSDELYANLLGVEGVQAVLYFKIDSPDVWEVGFRSSHFSSLDVGKISSEFGGGGHRKAAGATISSPLQPLKSTLIKTIASHLKA
jgi:phosphoesterase RecJ-like protein